MTNPSFHHTIVPQGYVSLNQACTVLGLSRPSVNRWVKKIDGVTRIVVNEVHYISQDDVDKIKEARSLV